MMAREFRNPTQTCPDQYFAYHTNKPKQALEKDERKMPT